MDFSCHTHRARIRFPVADAAVLALVSCGFVIVVASPRGEGLPSSSPPYAAANPLAQVTGAQDTTRRPGAQDTTGRLPQFVFPPIDSTGRQGMRLTAVDSLAAARADSARRDSIARRKFVISDSTYVVLLDSSARLRQFTHVRRDPLTATPFADHTYPLYAFANSGMRRKEMALDSTGARFSETVGGVDVKIPVQLSFDDYIALRRANDLRRMIAEEARRPKALVARDDLGDILSNITKISIPVPPNPLFSIFGKPEIVMNISGAVDIKAGFRNTKSDQTTISRLDQSRNEPDFSQEVQVNVNGTIGDKLNIMADWNTRRTFEYENQLKIKYTGYDDEIVQSVEAGNVSLQTPSSFIGSSQALFGVKAKFQTGPLTLTTIATQKKGQIKEVAVSGGAQERTFEMRAFEYATNHFFVDTSYIKYYEQYYQNEPALVNSATQIVEEEVWVLRQGGIPDPNERQAIAYIDLPPRPPAGYDTTLRNVGLNPPPGVVETGAFIRLDRSQYELDGDGYLGVLSLNVNVGDQQIVAIAYRRADGTQFGELTRNVGDSATTFILKMVKPKNLISTGPTYRLAWLQLLKNIYPIQGIGRNLKKIGFGLDILRRIPGSEDQNSILNEPLLRVFGVDKYSPDDTPLPNGDGLFDFRPGRTINQARAEIIFPYLRPFDEGIKKYFQDKQLALTDTSLIYPEIYDTTQTFAQQSLRNRYIMRGKATGEASSRYSLGFNVVEGSVQVLLNGNALIPNVDYTVDYIIGEVVIKNAAALVPGANVQIKYEQNDLFNLASKTLLGARGDLALSPTTNLGFTIMNLNQQTLSDKVRLNEEPNNNTILGLDGATSFNLPFLSRAIDALPILNTREPSSFRISGEAAYMLPDPNTKKSTIPSDGGEGVAYIDDFEGARRTIPVGIAFSAWTQGSPFAGALANATLGVADTTKMNSKGRMIWFNRLPTDVRLTEVFPNKKPGNAANDQATVLDFRYFPLSRGQFNYTRSPATTLTPARNWASVMKPLSVSAVNLLKENVNFIELWMHVEKAPPGGKMIIDLGSISEDAIPNRILNSEDLVLSSSPNGVLQDGEDVGIDMLNDAQERALYPDLGADPSGDDYSFSNATVGTPQEDFSHINGTENNKDGPGGRIPDTEDINANGIVDLANSYFEYEVSLDTVASRNPLIVGGGDPRSGPRQWYQFRIPIRDTTRTIGSPTFENIEYIRVGFLNTDTTFVRIADFSLVGNQWQKQSKDQNDSSFAVTVVGVEENPNYSSPPGVVRERDKTRPEEDVQANEQSLVLLLRGLPDGEARQAVKFYTYRALDLFNYRVMKMFVHGDDNFRYVDPANYDAEIFFRFGLDSLNYYEYRAPVRPGWDPLNDVVIRFQDLTAIKQGRDSVNRISDPIPVAGGPPDATYRVLGNPSLTQIVYLALGVENPLGKGTSNPLRGEIWFDELRLTSVDNTPGWAYRFDTQLKLADLGTVAFNYSRVDPAFHSLEQRFGSRQLTTSWGLATSVNLDKLFPDDWAGTSIPFSYSHTEADVRPKYLPNSDIDVNEAANQQKLKVLRKGGTEEDAQAEASRIVYESQTRRVSDTYALPNFRIALPSQAWYIRDTFNKLAFGFTYTRSTERNPAIVRSLAWSWNARITYALTLPPEYYIMPFRNLFDGVWFLDEYKNIRLYFPPTGFNWSFGATRVRSVSLQRAAGAQEITSRQFTASRGMGFGWKLTEGGLTNLSGDYNVSVESSLLDFELDAAKRQRSFSQILGDIFLSSRFINFGQDTRFSQRNSFNSKPNIPNIFNIKKYLDVSASYSVDYNWQNTLTRGDLGKSAGFANSINLQMNFKLKQLMDPLFEEKSAAAPALGSRGRRNDDAMSATQDTAAADTAKGGGLDKTLAQLKSLAKVLFKIPFFDYDNINISFTQTNAAQNSGVVGGTGFVNFWGRIPFFQEAVPRYGPSRLYQLGLISDPSGRLTNFGARSSFPFFGWDVEPGLRARGGVLVNTYRQTNRLSFKTTRELWEGARLDLNWNVGWSYNRTQNVLTDTLIGIPTIVNQTITGSVDRSYLTFPDVLFLGVFKTSLKEVSKKYAALKAARDSTTSDEEKLSKAFEEGFEALPFLRKIFGQYYPRINWTLRWDGLEKIPLFTNFVSRLSLDHAYTSNYTRQFQNRPGGGGERTDGQRVAYGFSPLVGLNFTFKELLKGSFGANFRYNTNTSYDLATSSRNIVETVAQEISITASYSRKGFEIPFFGLSLSNDIDISASYSLTRNSRRTYDVSKLDVNVTGVPLEGTTRTVIEPRIRYVLSLRVTASVYYRYTKIAPDDFGSRIPGNTTNEAGLDIHIAIQ
ncbi:MAG: cell surface protein SprA [Bacteroidota bacterium]